MATATLVTGWLLARETEARSKCSRITLTSSSRMHVYKVNIPCALGLNGQECWEGQRGYPTMRTAPGHGRHTSQTRQPACGCPWPALSSGPSPLTSQSHWNQHSGWQSDSRGQHRPGQGPLSSQSSRPLPAEASSLPSQAPQPQRQVLVCFSL